MASKNESNNENQVAGTKAWNTHAPDDNSELGDPWDEKQLAFIKNDFKTENSFINAIKNPVVKDDLIKNLGVGNYSNLYNNYNPRLTAATSVEQLSESLLQEKHHSSIHLIDHLLTEKFIYSLKPNFRKNEDAEILGVTNDIGFYERDKQMQILLEYIKTSRVNAKGDVAVIHGHAGLGKTLLCLNAGKMAALELPSCVSLFSTFNNFHSWQKGLESTIKPHLSIILRILHKYCSKLSTEPYGVFLTLIGNIELFDSSFGIFINYLCSYFDCKKIVLFIDEVLKPHLAGYLNSGQLRILLEYFFTNISESFTVVFSSLSHGLLDTPVLASSRTLLGIKLYELSQETARNMVSHWLSRDMNAVDGKRLIQLVLSIIGGVPRALEYLYYELKDGCSNATILLALTLKKISNHYNSFIFNDNFVLSSILKLSDVSLESIIGSTVYKSDFINLEYALDNGICNYLIEPIKTISSNSKAYYTINKIYLLMFAFNSHSDLAFLLRKIFFLPIEKQDNLAMWFEQFTLNVIIIKLNYLNSRKKQYRISDIFDKIQIKSGFMESSCLFDPMVKLNPNSKTFMNFPTKKEAMEVMEDKTHFLFPYRTNESGLDFALFLKNNIDENIVVYNIQCKCYDAGNYVAIETIEKSILHTFEKLLLKGWKYTEIFQIFVIHGKAVCFEKLFTHLRHNLVDIDKYLNVGYWNISDSVFNDLFTQTYIFFKKCIYDEDESLVSGAIETKIDEDTNEFYKSLAECVSKFKEERSNKNTAKQ